MKNIIFNLLNSTLFAPVNVYHCSQTIYQSLLGCLRLYDKTKENKWKVRSEYLCRILIKIQRPDGGFDIGYDFNFGKIHKKNESTSPELYALLALVEFYKRFGGINVKESAHKAANWVKLNAIKISETEWAIPYGPYSSKDVMVYNGTSFAAGALGVYLGAFFDSELEKIYHGMNRYLYRVMRTNKHQAGKFWFYSEQNRTDLSDFEKTKIDYYHQMQQVEIHSLAEISFSSLFQTKIIEEACDHVAFVQNSNGTIPYYNVPTPIHVWGYCSCSSAFILASKFQLDKKDEYLQRAREVLNWIYNNSWTGDYFLPIIDMNGKVVDHRFYVRSDSWVFNSFSLALFEGVLSDSFLEICEKSYLKMEKVNFSGIENHASNHRIRVSYIILNSLAKFKNMIWLK